MKNEYSEVNVKRKEVKVEQNLVSTEHEEVYSENKRES